MLIPADHLFSIRALVSGKHHFNHANITSFYFSFPLCFSGSPDQPGFTKEGAARHASVQPSTCQCGHYAEPNGLRSAKALRLLPSAEHGGQHGGGGRWLSSLHHDEAENCASCVCSGGDLPGGGGFGVPSA